jgi:hypothetical protein
MVTRLFTIGALLVCALAAFSFSAKAEASYYYDESYYNWSVPCYQYDRYGHCVSSSTRYRSGGRYSGTNYHNNYGNYYGAGAYRPVDNYYRSQQNRGCYWYYGSYRCDTSCGHR